jgi:CspA family cold shock protein
MSNTPTSEEPKSVRFTGKVKWFNNKSGFGFITVCDGEQGGNDIFVHYSSISGDDAQYKYLVQGEYVDFDLVKANNDKHEYHAVNISGVKGGHSMCETRRINMTTMQDVRQSQPRPVRDDLAPRTYRTRPNSSRQSDNSGGYVKSSKGPRVKNE